MTVTSLPKTEQAQTKRSRVPRDSFLEQCDFPLERLARLAVREGRRPRPIYTAHKWFARRMGSVFRALLIGATSEPDADFDKLFYGEADLTGLRVLDPFVGGGTSVFEAARLGATAFGSDVDPVACAVSRMELDATRFPDLSRDLQKLKATVGARIAKFYPDFDGTPLHYFWVQRVTCSSCSEQFDAQPNYVLANDGVTQFVSCRNCGDVAQCSGNDETSSCGACGAVTQILAGTVAGGAATCPSCSHTERLIEIGRKGHRPVWRLLAVETVQPMAGTRLIPLAQRSIRAPCQGDLDAFAQAEQALAEARASGELLLPSDRVDTSGWSDERLSAYGYRYWTDLFNPRQLLHLGLLAKEITRLPQTRRRALAMAFSDHLTTNCMQASYAGGWRRLTPLFSLRAFRHIQRPVELNPWIERAGRGTFPNAVRKLNAAATFARAPKEPIGENEFVDVPTRAKARKSQIHLGSATNLAFLADRSIDIVLTDPPYFDNIAYSELARFFQPWLELLDVIDTQELSPLDRSLVAKRNSRESIERYTEGLGKAFAEIHRVLRPRGIVAFSFRHTSAEAWRSLGEAIRTSGLRVSRVLPMPGEAGNGLHAQGDRGLWDAVFVLRRTTVGLGPADLTVTANDIRKVDQQVQEWKNDLKDCAIPFNKLDELALKRACLVGKSLERKRVSSEKGRVRLFDALEAVQPCS